MKEKYILNFPPSCSDKPITYRLVKEFDIKINILRAEITPGQEGRLLLELEGEEPHIKKGLAYLRSEGIRTYLLSREIQVRMDECVHCGSCTSVCFTGALDMDRMEWKLLFDPEKCVACELCIHACPLRLITLHFAESLEK